MKKYFLIFALIFGVFFGGCVSIHCPLSKSNFENLKIHFENVELPDSGNRKLIKTTISGRILDSALSISSYKIRYQGDKVFIDIDRKTGTSGMAMDYYIQFLMQPGVKDIYIGKDLFWTRSAESFFKSKNMKFPLNILVEKDYSAVVAQGPVEREISPEESASVKKFASYISKNLTMEKCTKWSKNAIAFEISDFGIFAEHDKKYLMISVQAYFEDQKAFDMRRSLGRHRLSVVHNILLFDYYTFQEKGWVY